MLDTSNKIHLRTERKCEICGKDVFEGMTDDDSSFYCHEDCFEEYMDETYGKHKWMSVNDDGEGGYYIYSDDTVVGGIRGTGIYYTQWYDEVEDILEAIDNGGEVVVIANDDHGEVSTIIYWKSKEKYYKFNKSTGVSELPEMDYMKFCKIIEMFIETEMYIFVRGN